MNIEHLPDKLRFRTTVEGHTAYVDYAIDADTLDILHTIVPVPIEGRGIASSLVKAAYDYALEQGLRPTATCTYAQMWLARHPEYKKATN